MRDAPENRLLGISKARYKSSARPFGIGRRTADRCHRLQSSSHLPLPWQQSPPPPMTGQRYRFVPGTAEEAPTARAAASGPGGRGTTDRCRTAVMGPRAREVGGKEQRYVVVYAPTTACTGRPSAGPHAARRSSVGNHFTPNHFLRRSRNLLPDRPAGYIRGLAQTFFTTFLSSLISQFFFILASSVTLSAASTFPASALV